MSTKTVYVVTSIFSPYKEDVDESSIKTFVFSDYNKAQEHMLKIARTNYKNLKEYEDSEEDDDEDEDFMEREEEDGRFFYGCETSVLYGEDKDYGVSYRRAWGLVKLEKVVMH